MRAQARTAIIYLDNAFADRKYREKCDAGSWNGGVTATVGTHELVVDDNEIMNHRRMAALTLLMKHIRHRDMMELLDKLPQVMVEISDEQVRVLIHYIVNAGDSVSPEFMRALAERLPQHEDKLMTIAERLEQKGRQEGRMEGALEKALAIACQLQKMGMTPEQIKQATGLSDDELKKIIH